MPDQRQIEEIKMAHQAAIREVMARYPSQLENRPVRLDDMGSALVSPFGPAVQAESRRLPGPHDGMTQQLPPVPRQDIETAEAGLGLSILALAGGLYVVFAYIRKMLD